MIVLFVIVSVVIVYVAWRVGSNPAAKPLPESWKPPVEPLADLLAGSKVVESAPPPAPYRPARVGERRVRGERRKG